MAELPRFHPLVADDLSVATSRYDEISADLGNRFRAATRIRFATVAERPLSYGRVVDELRAARVDRFPYVVLFEYDGRITHILGVFHSASDQTRWTERSG